ncbi:MAG: sulfurtransferase [Bryobacterales bacterium]|nr:sulfurtransferase [Bryobacterales bacterium]
MRGPWLAVTALAASLDAQSPRTHLLVSTGWLARHLDRPDIIVLHVTRDPASYRRGHIPGARLLVWEQFTTTREGIPNELPSPEELTRTFASFGVSDATRVILYGDPPGLVAARAWFTLDYLGYGDQAALLDGGLEKWRAEGRPVCDQEEPPPSASGRLAPRLRSQALVDFAFVRKLAEADDPKVLLLDTRSPEDYSGARTVSGSDRRGHIPGAINFYWPAALTNSQTPVFKPADELRRSFERLGATPDRRIVTYCGSGVQASLVYFLARYLGYDAALYDGSMSEWVRNPDAPLILGSGPR